MPENQGSRLTFSPPSLPFSPLFSFPLPSLPLPSSLLLFLPFLGDSAVLHREHWGLWVQGQGNLDASPPLVPQSFPGPYWAFQVPSWGPSWGH